MTPAGGGGRITVLEAVGRLFVVLVCATVWVPWSVDISGLNLRLSQIALPFVLVALGGRTPAFVVSRRAVVVAGCAGVFVGCLALWTLLAPTSDLHAFGRVGLYVLNLTQMAVGYLLVVRTRRVTPYFRTFIVTVAGLNVFFLLLAAGVALDVLPSLGMVARAVQPSLVDARVSAVMSWRIESGGVLAGCFSAGALGALLALRTSGWPSSPLATAVVGLALAAGLIVGFSRQAVLSLTVALAVVGAGLVLAGRLKALARVGAWFGVVVAGSILVALVTPGLRGYLDAFAGRTAQLLDRGSYSVGTARERTEMWGLMLNDISESPLTGRGQDAYMRYYPSDRGGGSHNLFVEVLHAGGLPALLALLSLHLIGFASALRTALLVRASRQDLATVIGVLSCAVATVFAAITNLIYWSAPYWLVLGWLLALGPLYRRRGLPGGSLPSADPAGRGLAVGHDR